MTEAGMSRWDLAQRIRNACDARCDTRYDRVQAFAPKPERCPLRVGRTPKENVVLTT